MSRFSPPGRTLRAILALIATVAVVVPAAVVMIVPIPVAARHGRLLVQRTVVPSTALPPVEPVEFVDLAPDEARAFNETVPFAPGPNPAAHAFRLNDGPEDLARATDCLATAVLYEAGADPAGQRAVAQVVLNRVRHPAFPKTVCGVVFEGQERRTGCQFSFTCDGALARWSPPAASWAAARKIASAALSGAVYRPVGYATHYHTDWVVPYWQSSLDKIARVGPHLFFRWTGWWGTPPAFDRRAAGSEPTIAAIAAFSDAHRAGTPLAEADAALDEATQLIADTPQALADDPDSFLVTLPAGLSPDGWPALAAQACGARPRCRLSAWTSTALTPTTLPLTPDQVATMSFSYLRDRTSRLERTLWNCRTVRRTDPRECMRQQVLLTGMAPVPTTAPPTTVQPPAILRGPTVLDGVRRAPVAPVAAAPSTSMPRNGANPPGPNRPGSPSSVSSPPRKPDTTVALPPSVLPRRQEPKVRTSTP